MSRGTTKRNIRISDELWDTAKELTAANDTTIADVVRNALEDYVNSFRES